MKSKLTRRSFLKRAATSSAALATAIIAVACDSGDKGNAAAPKPAAPKPAAPKPAAPKPAAAAGGCNDVSGLTDAEKTMRNTLKYVDATPDPAKRCDGCQLYVAAKAGANCGGCTVVKGPIAPAGYCSSWVAKA